MKKPSFFIVGAPKCGTTALSEYLRTHPYIFLSDPKEPRYFAEDMDAHRYVRTLDDYLALFADATPQQRMLGEASVDYLYSDVALRRIRAFNPEAKIIALVRNPVDMVTSLHRQLLFAQFEDEPDFGRAWQLQAERKQGRHVPSLCRAPAYLQYADACKLGAQVERLLRIFPTEQVKIILLDDLATDTAAVYRNVLGFLGLPDDGKLRFERVNEAKQVRFPPLARAIASMKPMGMACAMKVRSVTGLNVIPLLKRLISINEEKAMKQELSPALRQELIDAFRADVELLSHLLHRDLSHWLQPHA
jgi:hypothetical protein